MSHHVSAGKQIQTFHNSSQQVCLTTEPPTQPHVSSFFLKLCFPCGIEDLFSRRCLNYKCNLFNSYGTSQVMRFISRSLSSYWLSEIDSFYQSYWTYTEFFSIKNLRGNMASFIPDFGNWCLWYIHHRKRLINKKEWITDS